MDTSFQRKENSQEWFTPPHIIKTLGIFDLDPCAPSQDFYTATRCYTKEMDGLSLPWSGRVWLNPPYKNPLIGKFIDRMIAHGDGVALIFNRMDTALWHDKIFPSATAMLIIRGRIRFFRPDGTEGDSAGCGSVLVAWGEGNAAVLKDCGINGEYIYLNGKKIHSRKAQKRARQADTQEIQE